jgi:hypothetical protein
MCTPDELIWCTYLGTQETMPNYGPIIFYDRQRYYTGMAFKPMSADRNPGCRVEGNGFMTIEPGFVWAQTSKIQ